MIELNFLTWHLPDRKRRVRKRIAQLLSLYLLPILLLFLIFILAQRDLASRAQKNETRQNQIHLWMKEKAEYQKQYSSSGLQELKSQSVDAALLACFDALDQIHQRTNALHFFEIHPPTILLKMTNLRSDVFFNVWMKPWLEKTCMDQLSLSVEAQEANKNLSWYVIRGVLKGATHAF